MKHTISLSRRLVSTITSPPTSRPTIPIVHRTHRLSQTAICSRKFSTYHHLRQQHDQTSQTHPTSPSTTSTSTSTSTSQTQPQSPPSSATLIKTYYDFFPQTLPHGPPPQGPFHINLRLLRTEFLKRQQSTHPDLHPPHARKQAELSSSQLNKAYTTLLSPLLRAQYLLTLRGYTDPADDETSAISYNQHHLPSLTDGNEGGESHTELLMQVLEANEIIEEAESEKDLEGLKKENDKRMKKSVERLNEFFKSDDLEGARGEAVRLRYWVNVDEGVRNWEKGKGVELHH